MMNRYSKLTFSVLTGIFLFTSSFAVGQNEFFDIAVFKEGGSIDHPRFALNPDKGILVLTYTVRLDGKLRMIAVNTAKIRKSGNPGFKKTEIISDPNLNSVIPSIVYHPGLKQFLVMWHSFGTDGNSNLSIGGRLLNKKGKPANFSVGIGLGSDFDLTFPIALARAENIGSAPPEAEFFLVWVRRYSYTKVYGQWLDKKLTQLGEPIELIQFDNISVALHDSLLIDGDTGLFAIEENYFDDSGKGHYTLSVLRYFLDGSGTTSQIDVKKDVMDGWVHVDLLAASDKRVILGVIPDLKPTENYQIRNAGKLRAGKKTITVIQGELAISQNIVQLDDGRIFQAILTEFGEIVVQQLNSKGKPLGAPVARITPPFDARFCASQAIALPGRDDILIVLCDNSTPVMKVKGSIVQIN